MYYIYPSVLITIFAVVSILGKGQDYQTQEIPLEDGYVYHTFQEIKESMPNEDLINKDQDYLTGDGPIEDHTYQVGQATMKVMNYHIADSTLEGSDVYPAVGITEDLAHQKAEVAIEGHEYQPVEGNMEGYVFQPAEFISADDDIASVTNEEYSWKPYINIGDSYQDDIDLNQEFENELRRQGLLDDSDDKTGDDYSEGQTMEISTITYEENLIPAQLFAGIDTAFDFENIVPTTFSTLPTVDDGFEDERIRNYRIRVRNYLKQLSEENGKIFDHTIGKPSANEGDKKESQSKDSMKLGDTSHKVTKSLESAVEQVFSFFKTVGDNAGNIMKHIYETVISIFHQETLL